MMSDAVMGLMSTLSKEYKRDVKLTVVYRGGGWRAECAGIQVQSLVSPADTLRQLAIEMKAKHLSKDPTAFNPAVEVCDDLVDEERVADRVCEGSAGDELFPVVVPCVDNRDDQEPEGLEEGSDQGLGSDDG